MAFSLIVLGFGVVGSFVGFLEASGLSAIISSGHSRLNNVEYLTKEEFRRRMIRYPLYGFGIGCMGGALILGYARIRRRRD